MSIWNTEDLLDHDSAAAVIIKDGKLLVMDSSKHNKVGLPGGKKDKGETIGECLYRECKEELGIEIDLDETYRHSVISRIYDRDDIRVEVKIHIFLVKNYTGEIKNMESELHPFTKFLYPETIMQVYGDRLMDNLQVIIDDYMRGKLAI